MIFMLFYCESRKIGLIMFDFFPFAKECTNKLKVSFCFLPVKTYQKVLFYTISLCLRFVQCRFFKLNFCSTLHGKNLKSFF